MMKKAAALRYQSGERAPRVLARGSGAVAVNMERIAQASGVPVVQSAPLAGDLADIQPFEEVPEEYWTAVAEILKFVYETRGRRELHKR